MQLQSVISTKLKQYISVPEVSVVVKEIHSFAVYVLGKVAHPGRYELTGQATVLDVLARAGGLDVFASTSKIVIIRNEGSTNVHIPFDYDDAVSKGDEGQVSYLLSGDIVMVP
jgi:polysaccharide export outer membrane protein